MDISLRLQIPVCANSMTGTAYVDHHAAADTEVLARAVERVDDRPGRPVET